MKIISTGAADILLVDLPSHAETFEIWNNELGKDELILDCDDIFHTNIDLPEGYKYTILGLADVLTEEHWQSIVVTDVYYDPHAQPYPIPCYKDYIDDVWKWTATEAGHSLLKSQGILLENLIPEPQILDYTEEEWMNGGSDVYYDRLKTYRAAEAKVKNPLVIKAEKI